jgi:hypothetical protein
MQVDVQLPVRETVHDLACPVDGQGRLTDAGSTADRGDHHSTPSGTGLIQQSGECFQLACAPGEVAHRRRQLPGHQATARRRDRGTGRRVEIPGKDAPVYLAQFRTWFDAQIVHQHAPCPLVGLQRLGPLTGTG